MRYITWFEVHKDFCLAIGALLAPFAAVLVALVSAKWQAAALLKSTRMHVRANAFRDYRQRNIEKLREEIAAEIFYVSELRFWQQQTGVNETEAQKSVYDAMARKIRIRALQSAVSSDELKECFKVEEQLLSEIRAKPPRQVWSDDENLAFNAKVDALGNLYLKVLELEMQAAAEEMSS